MSRTLLTILTIKRNVMSSKSRSHVSSRAGGSKPPRTPGPKVGYNTIDKASKPTTLDGYRTSGPFRPPLKQVAQSRRPLTATNPHESHHGEASSSSHPYGNGGDNQVLNGQPIPRSGNDPGAFMQHQRRSPDFHDNPPSSSRTATSGHKRNTSSLSSRSALFAPVLSNPSSVTRGRQIRSQGSSSPTKISRHRSPEQDLSIQNSSDEDTIQDPLGPFRKELEAEGIYQMSSQKIGPSKFPSRAPYVELQEKPDREPPSTTNRRIDLSEKGSVKKLVKNLEEKAQDDEWAINQGPPRHDIHRSTATSSQVSSKPVAGQQTRPPTDIRPGQPVPPSLSKSAPTHSATVQHMADVQRAWMLVGNDYGFPFPLKVVNIGISGDCIQLDSGPSIGTVLVNPLDLAQCSVNH
ncbi:hypothetical protein BD324DRAFT_155475 [Kockovaella imperatae]|uniref:Uncharacterized protein n=1 Tax=Kockovaella imperatae TaxID=4999 RepID=A0A1Y1U8X3_9TREE|nr:hypothetical protein BD324DRAFT_155475 [Kockovaella imperatae]ORX34501.1 hypothetical protein BD324DRAFT_155475 [Kockovaella imperatae]